MLTLQDIQDAAARLSGQVLDTPCVESRTLSQIVGAQVFLKFENLQLHFLLILTFLHHAHHEPMHAYKYLQMAIVF